MKKFILVLLMVISSIPLYSEGLTNNEINKSISAIIDISYVATSQFLSFQESEIPTIAIRVPQNKLLPDAVIVNEADMASFLPYFIESTKGNSSSVLAPVKDTVRQQLTNSDWSMGEAIITGASAIVFNKDQSVFSLITKAISGNFPKVGLVTDFTVTGSEFSKPVHVEGTFIVSVLDDYSLDINAIDLVINDTIYNLDNM